MAAHTTDGTEAGNGDAQAPTCASLQRSIRSLTTVVNNINVNAGGYAVLTVENDEETLPEDKVSYFVYSSWEGGTFTVHLPDAEAMAGKELTFVGAEIDSEYSPNIVGPIGPPSEETDTTVTLNNTYVLKLLCDGSRYWITQYWSFD